jgi:hypothetical protein
MFDLSFSKSCEFVQTGVRPTSWMLTSALQEMETALYLGCGTDVAPLLALQHTIQKFVLVDSQPASEFGHLVRPGLERPRFLATMRAALYSSGFSFSRKRSDTNWIFVNRTTSAIVSLWINCPFPFRGVPLRLLEEVGQASTLICCGFVPHRSILEWMRHPRCFVSNTATILDPDEYEEDTVCPEDFVSWSLIVLPPKYWCKTRTAEEVPQCLDFWSLDGFLTRYTREMKRSRMRNRKWFD